MLPTSPRIHMGILNELRWQPKIGDPTIIGWFTVVAYGIAAILAYRTWRRKKDKTWLCVALGMAALCVNKQLDLQSLFTDIGRVIAYHLDLYQQRRGLQKWFIYGVVAIAGISGTWFIWRHHSFWTRHKLLTIGIFFLVTFIVVRAISFHHFDSFLKTMHFGVKMNCLLELGGISMIILAAQQESGKFK